MFAKIGRKLAQGAKEEIQENPPVILEPDTIASCFKAVVGLAIFAMALFGGRKVPKQASTTVINYTINIFNK